MTVRSALARINEILDQVLSEQEGDFDSTSRFAIQWYRRGGYGIGQFGDAHNLARARNTRVEARWTATKSSPSRWERSTHQTIRTVLELRRPEGPTHE